MAFDNILLEQVETGIYLLTINRPESYNALNGPTIQDIDSAITVISEDPDARALILTGAGEKAFVAGADIKAMQNLNGIEAQRFSDHGMKTFRKFELLDIPVIGAINGFCLGGGCELAMSCDWMIAADTAQFGQPEVNLGVTPGLGGSQRLTRLIGRARAMEMIMTGNTINAEQALSWGLINHIYPADQLMDEAIQLGRTIAKKGPLAIKLSKQLIQRGQDLDLDNACMMETQAFGLSFSTADQTEGMTAFIEKRKADFKGR